METVIGYVRTMHRRWMRVVTMPEFLVLSFVFDRTWGWSKRRERITLEQFQHGVWQKKGGRKCISGGTGLTKPAIMRAIKTLCGDTYRDSQDRTPLIRIVENSKTVHFELDFDCLLPIPEGPRNIGNPALPNESTPFTDHGKTALPLLVNAVSPKRIKEEGKEEDKSNAQSNSAELPCQCPGKALWKYKESGKHKESGKPLKTFNSSSSVYELEAIWKETVEREFEEVSVLPWTKAQAGMVSTLRKKWLGAENAKSGFDPFLKWCVVNWKTVIYFAFRSKAARFLTPDKPTIEFLVRCAQTFIDAYHNDDNMNRRAKGPSRYELERREARLKIIESTTEKLHHQLEGDRAVLRALRLTLQKPASR